MERCCSFTQKTGPLKNLNKTTEGPRSAALQNHNLHSSGLDCYLILTNVRVNSLCIEDLEFNRIRTKPKVLSELGTVTIA